MITRQLKLRVSPAQEKALAGWLWTLTGAWNTAVRRIELDARDGVYHSKNALRSQLVGHSERLGVPLHVLQSVFTDAGAAWSRCFKKRAGRPRLKGARRRLNSIPFPDPIRAPSGNRIAILGIGRVRFHRQQLPQGRIKCARLVRRASGWHLCLFIDAERAAIERRGAGSIGIDPGFSSLLTLSNGEKIDHPRELERSAVRLAKAQRGCRTGLAARIQERIANQKKDRNHKLSLDLVRRFSAIYFSRDNIRGIAKRFGRSVSSSSHYQLRQMLSYKSRAGGAEYVEVDSKFSTRICHACGGHHGPAGLAGLSARHWVCSGCGNPNDRDVNAAINTLIAGVGRTLEAEARERSSGLESPGHPGSVNNPMSDRALAAIPPGSDR